MKSASIYHWGRSTQSSIEEVSALTSKSVQVFIRIPSLQRPCVKRSIPNIGFEVLFFERRLESAGLAGHARPRRALRLRDNPVTPPIKAFVAAFDCTYHVIDDGTALNIKEAS